MGGPDVSTYYERYWRDSPPPHELGPQLRALYEEHVQPGDRCLDLGCGDGRKSGLWLAHHAGSYVGVDISEAAVAQARALDLDARVVADASDLPLDEGAFDVAVCIEVLEHLFEPQRALSEVFRVLRPGGTLIATVPNVAYWRKRLELGLLGRWDPHGDERSVAEPWRDPHLRFFNRRSLERLLRMSGFEPARIGGLNGALLCDVPPFGRRRERNASGVYRLLERRWPGLLGIGLYAVAVKPSA